MAKLLKPRHWHRGVAIIGLGLVLVLLWVGYVVSLVIPWVGRRARKLITQAFKIVKRLIASVLNMLAIFDNDVGSTLLVMENCLRHEYNQLLDSKNLLRIDGNLYSEIVLTPLMMDFGHKGRTSPAELAQQQKGKPPASVRKGKKLSHYDVPAEKPIVAQVVDVFAAITKYMNTTWSAKLQEDYPELGQGTKRVFHIYPFLGLNTANYDLDGLKKLLTKYFSDYRGLKEDLDQKMGQFDGHIENLNSNFFAGIKVYPPLGFDPWPEDEIELDKVQELYRYAQEKRIPVTCHGGSGGFRAVPLATAVRFAAIPKWEAVLGSYPDLKLDLAHFPMKIRELTRRNRTFQLLMDNKNVYVDISCRATTPDYYEALAQFISKLSEQERTKFMQRLLFGSDFAVNLLWSESYNAYISLFRETTTLTPEDKQSLCSVNPESFLFNEEPVTTPVGSVATS
ncbi:amidohydrolase family protein [Candidatus Bipolaricaulota bacterium]